MDTPPPALEGPFEEESLRERILGLNEMFPESLRNAVSSTFSTTFFCIKKVFSASRIITWAICSTSAILVLPLSLEMERQEYEQQMKRQERNIILGSEAGGNI